jgi:diguanylate cyclase (GGDEF)-like protein/PAS domain S-box-containing protein
MPFTSDQELPAAILEHAIESVATAVSITDADDRILFVNRTFLDMYGYSEADLPTLRIADLRSPRVPEPLRDSILPATVDGGWTGILWQKRKDGSEFLVELVTSRVVDGAGAPIALIGAAHDITEEMHQNERQDCLFAVARAVQDASTLRALYPAIHEIVVRHIPADGFTLYLQWASGAPFEIAYDAGHAGPPASAALELVKHVVASGRPLKIAPEEWDEIARSGLVGSGGGEDILWLGAPLVADGRAMGAIVLRNVGGVPYDDKDVELLEYAASSISQAIVRKRVEEDRHSDLSFKTALSLAVSNAGLGIVVLLHGRIVYANGAAAALSGFTTRELQDLPSFLDVLHPDERERVQRRFTRQAATFLRGETYATALQTRSGARVEVQVSVQPFALGEENRYVATLHDVTPLVRSARADTLTGLPNRQASEEALLREWHRAKRRSGARPRPEALLSLLSIDADQFAPLNEENGTLAGDEMLRRAALVMRAQLRGADFLGRWGGEEFVALLPDTGPAGARAAAERLREAVERGVAYDVRSDEGEPVKQLRVTISVGVASVDDTAGLEYGDLVSRAHRALAEAKKHGRNRVVVSGQA